MKLLTNKDAAALLGLKPNTLDIWRIQGKGPIYRKVGRSVRYAESDVTDWLEGTKCKSTSDYSARSNSNKFASV